MQTVIPIIIGKMVPFGTWHRTMNLLKNSSVAFAVSIAELTMFAMQAQEETSRGIEIYLAVTLLYAASAFAVNRIFALIEKKAQIPGFVMAGAPGGGH